MKNNRRIIVSILWVLLGIGLIIADRITKIDEFWVGLGTSFALVGSLQLFRWVKYSRDPQYREQVEVAQNDERNRYLNAKAWSWAGYLFVLICAVACIVLRIVGEELLSMVAGGAICLMVILYWASYLIVKRKY